MILWKKLLYKRADRPLSVYLDNTVVEVKLKKNERVKSNEYYHTVGISPNGNETSQTVRGSNLFSLNNSVKKL